MSAFSPAAVNFISFLLIMITWLWKYIKKGGFSKAICHGKIEYGDLFTYVHLGSFGSKSLFTCGFWDHSLVCFRQSRDLEILQNEKGKSKSLTSTQLEPCWLIRAIQFLVQLVYVFKIVIILLYVCIVSILNSSRFPFCMPYVSKIYLRYCLWFQNAGTSSWRINECGVGNNILLGI